MKFFMVIVCILMSVCPMLALTAYVDYSGIDGLFTGDDGNFSVLTVDCFQSTTTTTTPV